MSKPVQHPSKAVAASKVLEKRMTPKAPATVEARTTQRRRMTQAERRDQTRAKILEASAVLLRKRGFSGLRTLEVAEAAGVSQGAQFHHFPIGITSDDDPELQDAVRTKTREFRVSVEEAWAASMRKSGIAPAIAGDVLALTLSLVRGFAVRTLIDPDPTQAERLFKLWRAIIERHIKEEE